MRAHKTLLMALACGALTFGASESLAADKVAELQARFDHENSSVHKAKLLAKLGDAQLEAARAAGKAGDYNAVGVTFEKYRDNCRIALDALKKEHPDAERQSSGYRQLEIHVREGIRELNETLLVTPEDFKPPLQLVREDLIHIEDDLLRSLFPRRKEEPAKPAPPKEPPADQPSKPLSDKPDAKPPAEKKP
jgi:hypothetical protein